MSRPSHIATSIIALATALAASPVAAQTATNSLFFQINPNIDPDGLRQVFIFGQPGTTGTVVGASGFNQAFTLAGNGFTTITVPIENELLPDDIENKGFRVSASAPVSGYLLNRRTQSTDMTFLIDGDRLGTDYVAAGYGNNVAEDQLSVQATVDDTLITFVRPGGATSQINLDAGQTFLITAALGVDLAGTRVTGSAPIAVFSGNVCANVPSGIGFCDHLVEQLPSIDQLSSTYYLAQTPRTGTQGNIARVIATADDTEVRINGALVATIGNGQFYEGRVVGGQEIVASKPVLVTQYLIGQGQANANTDPAMTIVPGADQWLSSYVFASPSGEADFPTDFISIIMRTADVGTLTIDSVLANPALFNPLGSTIFSFGNFDVSDKSGPFTITAASPFQLLLSGFDSFDSYFTYGGALFAPGASPDPDTPPPPPPALADVFWDGDGNPDDSVINGGNGVLTATSLNLTVNSGVTNNALPIVPANIIFTAAPGTVTVDDTQGDIPVSGLRFRVDGYVISGAPLILAGANGGNVIIETGGSDIAPPPPPEEEIPEDEEEIDDVDLETDAMITAVIASQLTGESGITKIGAGTAILTGLNDYTGGTIVDEGTLIGSHTSFGSGSIAINAALVFDQAITGSFGNGLTGSGSLTKQGLGRLTLTGENSFDGDTTVAAGTLQVDGNLGSSFTSVLAGGRLGGIGTVGGVRVLSGGRIAPGQSIGTLNVSGTADFDSGSIYELELNSTGQSDRIIATGAATVASGAFLQLIKTDAPRYVLGTRYTVLTGVGRTGLFTLQGATRVSQFINIIQTSDANNVYLNVSQTRAFAAAGLTPNQIAAATGADAPANGALYTAIAYLQTDAEAQSAFDAISGEVHASIRAASFEDSRFVREAITNRFATSAPGERGLWMHGYGSWGDFDGDGNAADVRRNLGGFFLGGELLNNDSVAIGILAGYGTGDLRVAARNSTADFEDVHLGAYGTIRAGGFTAKLGLAHMWRDVQTRRSIAFTGFSDQLGAAYDLRLFQAFADLGYMVQATPSFAVEPFASLAYVSLNPSQFRETGGTAALATARPVGTDVTFANLGARLHFGLASSGIKVIASGAWRHAAGGGRADPLRLGFAAGPAFDISAAPIAEDAAALSLQLSGNVSNTISLGLGYSGQVGSRLSDHGVRGNFTLRF